LTAEEDINVMQSNYQNASKAFIELLEHFSVPKQKINNTDPPSFFGTLKEFLSQFHKGLEKLQKPVKAYVLSSLLR
jgi:hypothetical protein